VPTADRADWLTARRRRIGARIGDERRRARLTQEAVANQVGIDRPSMVLIEQGARNATIDTLLLIADAIGVDLADLVR
jgi:transcriptional regulator with XRE-family HTH domain